MPTPDRRVDTAARGRVHDLAVHVNTAGRAWATFTLVTPGGAVPCVCFPRTFGTLRSELEPGRAVVVEGQAARHGSPELRVVAAGTDGHDAGLSRP